MSLYSPWATRATKGCSWRDDEEDGTGRRGRTRRTEKKESEGDEGRACMERSIREGEQRGTKDELLVSGVLVGEASTRADK